MGNCIYCGHPAGILRSKHGECEQQHQQVEQEILQQALQCVTAGRDPAQFLSGIKQVAREGFIRSESLTTLLCEAWSQALDVFLDDGVLSDDEERRLENFVHGAGLSTSIAQHPSYPRLAKARLLRAIASGGPVPSLNQQISFSINLQRGEQVVWIFHDVDYLEDRERREIVGRSHGLSIRVMTGVYYRVGAFKGSPVTHQERVKIGTGSLYVTDKNLYFAGSTKSFRVPYSKIVAFDQFSDGIGIMRDAASAKPQIFVTHDGWFSCNLIMMLAQQ